MSDQNNSKDKSGAGIQGLPLFYRQPEALNPEPHGALRLDPSPSLGFAHKTNALPLTAAEFFEACRHFPIVFVGKDKPFAAAIVGLRDQENLFVDENGAWADITYIPAYVRRYPFVFVQRPESDEFILCIDRASERVNTEKGDLFFEGAEATEMTKNALQFCSAYQRQHMATKAIVDQFVEHDLLVDNQGTFRLPSGQTLTLRDFKVIDEERFNALSDDALVSMRKTGALAAAFAHLISQRSWNDLVSRAGA